MVVQAYILIQTEVGKAAAVAEEIAEIPGVDAAEDVTGPTTSSCGPRRNGRRPGQARRRQGPGGRRHHPHADVHRSSTSDRVPSPARRALHGSPLDGRLRRLRDASRRVLVPVTGPRRGRRTARCATTAAARAGSSAGRAARPHRGLGHPTVISVRVARRETRPSSASTVDGVDWVSTDSSTAAVHDVVGSSAWRCGAGPVRPAGRCRRSRRRPAAGAAGGLFCPWATCRNGAHSVTSAPPLAVNAGRCDVAARAG